MTKPIDELYKIAEALQTLVGERAKIELFQDPTTNSASLKVERDSEFSPRTILKTSDIRSFPLKLTNMLTSDPEESICESPDDIDHALADILASGEMHELLRGIMAGR